MARVAREEEEGDEDAKGGGVRHGQTERGAAGGATGSGVAGAGALVAGARALLLSSPFLFFLFSGFSSSFRLLLAFALFISFLRCRLLLDGNLLRLLRHLLTRLLAFFAVIPFFLLFFLLLSLILFLLFLLLLIFAAFFNFLL